MYVIVRLTNYVERKGEPPVFVFYLKKLLRCPATYAGSALFFLSIILSVSETWTSRNPTYLYQYAMNLGITHFFIPVVAALPICFVRRELSRGSTWQFPLLRSSPRRFSAGGLAAACLSGAVVTVLGFLCFFLTVVLSSGEALALDYTLVSEDAVFFQGRSYLEITLIELAGLALMSMIHPAVAYLVSGYSNNQYLCAAFPFILYMFALFTVQRLGYYVDKRFLYLDPSRLNPSGSTFTDSKAFPLYVLSYVLTVALICGLLFGRRLRRRLRDG